MDNLLLLQFGSLLITALMGLMLCISRIHVRGTDIRYETSRWLLAVAMFVYVCHYLLQMFFGFRAQGDDVGAVVNILFYTPAVYLISYSIINLASGKDYRRRYLRVSIASYSVILLTFIAGLMIYRSLHLGWVMYVMEALFAFSIIFAIADPLKERRRILNAIERDTAGDLGNYNMFLSTGTMILFLFALILPGLIFSRVLLFVLGPLFLLTMFVFVVNFVCLVFNISPVVEVLDSEEHEPKKNEPVQEALSAEDQAAVGQALEAWRARQGFADSNTSLDRLARRIGVPPRKLSLYIGNVYGETFRVWLSKIRMEEAKRMLVENPDAKIEVVAEECGFTSRSYFQNLFKAETGYTPKEWRTKMCVS